MLNIEEFADNSELFDGHYALIRPLSVDGATADVWLALDTNTVTEDVQLSDIARLNDDEIEKLGLMVAIKIYRPQNALDIEGEQRFRDEYMIVFNCHHTNLIHPTHFSIFKETPYLVLPYCKLGSSELLVGNLTGNDNIWKYIKDVSSGLEYLHTLNPPIIHQDIKPANILLDDTNHYAITDFGISSQRGGTHEFYNDEDNSGTLAYMAPERFLEGAEPMPQSDIWAFGATLCEILTGKVPFGEEGGKNQMESNVAMPVIPNVSSDIQRLIHACLSKEPGDRPSAKQIKMSAEAKQYPIKSKKFLFLMLNVIAILLIFSTLYFFFKPETKEEVPQLSNEELYEKALNMIASNNIETFSTGINLMDSLSKTDYLPAIYEMAFSYGCYSNPESKRRKRLLGFSYEEPSGKPKENYELSFVLSQKIISHKDSSLYSLIEADAHYRIGVYYCYVDTTGGKAKETLDHWKTAYKWALQSKNDSVIKEISYEIERLQDKMKN